MSLSERIKTAQRIAERQGLELYGYQVLADGSVRGMMQRRRSAPPSMTHDPDAFDEAVRALVKRPRRGVRPEQESLL